MDTARVTKWGNRALNSRLTSPALLLIALLLGVTACTSSGSKTDGQTPSTSAAGASASSPAGTPVLVPSSTTPASPSPSPTLAPTSPTVPASTGSSPTASSPKAATSAATVPAAQRFAWKVDPNAASTAEARAAIKAAEPIYAGYMATYDDSLRAPKTKDWQPVMANYAAAQALSAWRNAWQGQVKYGLMQRGTTTAVGHVDGAGLTADGVLTVSIRACMDFTHVDTVDTAGNKIPIASGLPSKDFAWLLTIEKVGGQPRVSAIVSRTQSGKTFSC